MMCPEPDFWIHAVCDESPFCVKENVFRQISQAVELAKTPRVPTVTKANSKGKGKEKQKEPALTYDYSEASVHDMALKAEITKGYERFKVLVVSYSKVRF